jgi:hypothetical protein
MSRMGVLFGVLSMLAIASRVLASSIWNDVEPWNPAGHRVQLNSVDGHDATFPATGGTLSMTATVNGNQMTGTAGSRPIQLSRVPQ